MTKALLIIIGSLSILYSAFIAARMKFNSGIVIVALSGAALTAIGIFQEVLMSLTWFRITFFVSLAAAAILVSVIAFHSVRDNAAGNEDAVIILGSGLKGSRIGRQLKSRLDTAARYCLKNNKAYIVVSGGMGSGETVTEASAMKKYLVSAGVGEWRIIEEDRSTSTYTNFKYSKEKLDAVFEKERYKTVIITSGYHIFRSITTAKKAGLDCTHVHSSVPFCQIPVSYARECAAVIKYLLF